MHVDGIILKLKELGDAVAYPLYVLRGRQPWSVGYYTNKKRCIEKAIDNSAVQRGLPLPGSFGVAIDERAVEYPWLFSQLRNCVSSLGRVLDAGSTLNHDYILNRAPLLGADLTIMTLAPEKRCYWYLGYSYVFGDFRKTRFEEASFDTIICISTLEHVGLDNTILYTNDRSKLEADRYGYIEAVREFRRILAPGGRCFITVPFGRHENFEWFQVFDEGMVRALIDNFGPSSVEIEYFGYNERGWQRAAQNDVLNAAAYDPLSGRGKGDDRAGCARAIACIELTV